MIDTAYFLGLFFVILRLSAFFFVVDIFFPNGTPKIMKILFSVIVSISVVSGVDYNSLSQNITSNYNLMYYSVNEIMTGILFGAIVNLIFIIMKFAGAWMDYHVGFMMTSMIDPATNTQSTLLGNLTYMISILIFFIINGHHVLIKCLVSTFSLLNIGSSIITQDNMMQAIQIIIQYFVLAIKIAIPIVLIIIIIDLSLGLITRVVPTIPAMIFGVPIKMFIGLLSYIVVLPMLFKIIIGAINQIPQIFESLLSILAIMPVFFIFDDEKTEEATPKKLSDAKNKGQVARSREVNTAFSLVVCTFLIASFTGILAKVFNQITVYFFSFPEVKKFSYITLKQVQSLVTTNVLKMILTFSTPLLITGICASVLQTGFIFTKEPLKFSLGKLKPKLGFKNIFSKRSLLNLAKNIVVIVIIGYMAYKYITNNYERIMAISNLNLQSIIIEFRKIVVNLFKQVCLVMIVIAATDYYFQKKMYKKSMKMSKQEVKDEYKNAEGDPQIKAKIKQKQREISMRRMMQSVSDATVVITNPTHLAIAIKYVEDGTMEAPKVVAKGADYVAIKIKSIAKDNNVPVVENKLLARMMYDRVEIDQDIPQDLYQGVAEILAVILRIKK